RTLLLAGNWKMNHDHLEAISSVQKLAWALEDAKLDDSACEVVVIPPFTDIRSVQTLVQGDKLWLKYGAQEDRKSTRLNSSHVSISYAVFCLKKKNAHGVKDYSGIPAR